jgi:hypothetical protein
MEKERLVIISVMVGLASLVAAAVVIGDHYADEPDRTVAECRESCEALGAEYVLVNRYGCICQMSDELTTEQEDLISRRFVLTEQLAD